MIRIMDGDFWNSVFWGLKISYFQWLTKKISDNFRQALKRGFIQYIGWYQITINSHLSQSSKYFYQGYRPTNHQQTHQKFRQCRTNSSPSNCFREILNWSPWCNNRCKSKRDFNLLSKIQRRLVDF